MEATSVGMQWGEATGGAVSAVRLRRMAAVTLQMLKLVELEVVERISREAVRTTLTAGILVESCMVYTTRATEFVCCHGRPLAVFMAAG